MKGESGEAGEGGACTSSLTPNFGLAVSDFSFQRFSFQLFPRNGHSDKA
jgi:hypothetical protein